MSGKKLIISISLVFLANTAAGFGLFLAASKIFSFQKEIDGIKKELRLSEGRIMDSAVIKNKLLSMRDDKEKIDSLFLEEEELVRLIEKFESVAAAAGVDLKINSASVSGAGKENSRPRFSMAVDGSFGQIFQYLCLLENLPYFLEMQRVNFQKAENADGWPEWRANFELVLKVYEKS